MIAMLIFHVVELIAVVASRYFDENEKMVYPKVFYQVFKFLAFLSFAFWLAST